MKAFKVTHRNKSYKVIARDADEAQAAVMAIPQNDIEDDRLSPMTYRKLKEMGYGHEDWKDLSQEQANKIVQQETGNPETSESVEKLKNLRKIFKKNNRKQNYKRR